MAPSFIVALREVAAEVRAARFLASRGGIDHQPRDGEQVLQLPALAFVELAAEYVSTPEIDIAIYQQAEVMRLVTTLRAALAKSNASRDIALAALAELGSELAETPPAVTPLVASRSLKHRRVG